jgi:hypothetical protein
VEEADDHSEEMKRLEAQIGENFFFALNRRFKSRDLLVFFVLID